MKRRAKGTGTIIKQGDWYYGRIVSKGKVKVIKLSKNQRESEGLWKQWLEANPTSSAKNAVKHSINESWFELSELYNAKGTSNKIKQKYHNHFKNFLDWTSGKGLVNLEEIKSNDVVEYINNVGNGKSNTYKRDFIRVVKGLYSANGIKESPADKVKVAKDLVKPREPFTDDELKTILETAQNHKAYPEQFHGLIIVGLYTGLRLKDCVYLSSSEVKGDVIMLAPKKTKHKGIEVRIPVHQKVADELVNLGTDNSGYYFPGMIELYEKGNIENHLRSIFSSVGEVAIHVSGRTRKVPVKGFHALRATFITRLAEKNVSLPIMESLAGHLNPTMTLHYTHPNEEIKKAAIDVLSYDDSSNDKIFMHPEVKKLMDAFEEQKNAFLDKIEKKISELVSNNEIKIDESKQMIEASRASLDIARVHQVVLKQMGIGIIKGKAGRSSRLSGTK